MKGSYIPEEGYPIVSRQDKLLISIITVVYNGEKYIESAIKSVISQNYENIEYIIIDGGSIDDTPKIIEKYSSLISKYVSEPDDGIYDAMNKGIRLATGDIVGILNSDDFYVDDSILANVARIFEEQQVDAIFADLVIVDENNTDKIIRYYDSSSFKPDKFAYGWMPAHPTFFVKRICYEQFGLFKTNYKIAADYELLARFISRYKISYAYWPKVIVKMRSGGVSTRSLKSNWILNKEIARACRENDIKTNMFKVLSKYPRKLLQLFVKPNQ